MPETATLQLQGKTYNLPVVIGTEGEVAVDISKLRADSGAITLDDGYSNTGSCKSAITFIDGETGHPPLPRHPDRADRRAQHVRRDRLAADLRRAADRRAAAVLEQPAHQARDAPRGALQALRRLPVAGPPDGDPLGDGQRRQLLQPRRHQDGEPRDVPERRGPPPQQDADDRGGRLQGLDRPAARLPEAAPRLLLELPPHDVLDPVQGVRAGSRHRRTRCS